MATTGLSSESVLADDLVIRITEAVAKSSGTDPLTLPPLEQAVDTDALDALVDSDGLWNLKFSYYDHIVTIDGDGHVQIAQIDQ